MTLSVKELAAALHVTPRTLHTLVVTGQIPMPVRIGQRRIVWRVADIEKFLEHGGTPGLQQKARPGRPRKNGGAS
ncbi:MAG: helix-turn-helix domain-containing protein [Gammaproteobacteria bacterium]|nr:helix-turn-helix domain-containing protein [Gammaproteobacteria bacterium]